MKVPMPSLIGDACLGSRARASCEPATRTRVISPEIVVSFDVCFA